MKLWKQQGIFVLVKQDIMINVSTIFMKIPLHPQIQSDPCLLADIHSLTVADILPLTVVDTLAHSC